MKKKFGIIVSIMLVLVMLIGTLVACKEPEKEEHGKGKVPVGGATSVSKALPEILGHWMDSNSYGGEDILAWDMRFDYEQGDKSSLGIDFKGAITNNNNDDIFELSITDNKLVSDDKTVIGIIVNKDAVYLNTLGNSFKMPEVNIESLAINTGTEASFNDTLNLVLELIGIVGGMVDDGTSTVDISKADDGSYTKDYSLSLDIWGLLEGLDIESLINGLLNNEGIVGQEGTVAQIVDILEGSLKDNIIKINGSITDLVLEETIDEKEEDIYYHYDLKGGELSPNGISVGLEDSTGATHDVAISGLEIINTMPNISIPTENVKEISILKHEITGNFTMKNNTPAVGEVAGSSTIVSTYSYKIHIEFGAEDIVKTLAKCIADKSPAALIDQLFKNQDGKIFIDVYHTCDTGCVKHLAGNKFDGSILTIAYDPAEGSFNNNSVYASAHLKAILPDGIFEVIDVPNAIVFAVPNMISFVIDPLLFYEMDNAKKPTKKTSSVTEESPIDIAKVITGIIAALSTTNGTVDIDFNAITEVLLNDLGLDDATKAMISEILGLIFPDITTLSINSVYTNGANLPEGFNGMTEFMKLNDKKNKEFSTLPFGSGKVIPMKGDYDFTSKIDNENVKISSNLLYNEDGTQKIITHEEFMAIISTQEDASSSARVAASFVGTDGKTYKSNFRISGVIGLDPTIINTPQTVDLVLSRGSGASIFTLLDLVGGVGGAIMPELKSLLNIFMPEAMVQTTITLSEVKSDVWSQAGIGSTDNHIDSAKEYSHTDEIVTQFTFTRTYTSGVKEVYTVAPSNNIFNTMNAETKTSTFKVYADATLNYSAGNGKYTHQVPIKFNEASVTDAKTINTFTGMEIDFAKEIMNTKTGKNLNLSESNAKSIMDAFVLANPNTAKYVVLRDAENSFKSVGLTFSVAGTYSLTIKGSAGDVIVYTIIVEADVLDDTIFNGDNLVGESKRAFLDVPIAIGLIKTEEYSNGPDVVTIITEFTSVMKGENLDTLAVLGTDYTINAATGEVTFFTEDKYVFNLVFGEKTYTVHFNAIADEIITTYEGANDVNSPISAYTDTFGYSVKSVITKAETNVTEGRVTTIITDGYVVTLGAVPAVLGTDYTISTAGVLVFKTAGNYIFSFTGIDSVVYSVHYTVVVDAVESTVITGNEAKTLTVGSTGTVVFKSNTTYLSGKTEEKKTTGYSSFKYTVEGTGVDGSTALELGTDYTVGKSYSGRSNQFTFKTAGTYVISCDLNGVNISVTYTVTAAA